MVSKHKLGMVSLRFSCGFKTAVSRKSGLSSLNRVSYLMLDRVSEFPIKKESFLEDKYFEIC